ncbi:hypothetical protein J6590_071543 [Homalodisca vitripennis]|nr:hypothetical protein J6590_071543 [Homalodisca vitripennis]
MAANLLYSDRLRDADNYVTFSLNGKIHKVWGLPAGTTLLQYIREHAHLKGTKYMCREGGCGSCIVNLTFTDPVTGIDRSFGINSCLYALYSCQGMSVTTIEGIGSKQKGYSPVQTRLANFCGSQCGFCSPGWVMAMYSLLKTDKDMSMKQIEDSFGSNNCRCTGYRPILEAFKTFAENSTVELHKNVGDIEDLSKGCSIRGDHIKSNLQSCAGNPSKEIVDVENIFNCQYFEPFFVELALSPTTLCVDTKGSSHWYKVTKVQEIFEIFTMINGSYMLVGGNTAQGVFEEKYPTPPDIYIDINGVLELKSHSFNSVGDLVLGANKSLTDTITLFRAVAVEKPESFSYLKILAKHMTKVAHIPVRNVGTLAGNLSAKYVYPRFPSDLFTIFETVGAQLIIDSGSGLRSTISLSQFLQINMCKRVITNIVFKPFDETYIVRTYKVMRRAQNDHAVVNAGFCFSFNRNKNFKVLQKPRIVYGGVRPDFIHAIHTESYLEGKCLLNTATLQKTLSILSAEVVPDRQLPESSEQYRNGLASSLFYRFVLGLSPSSINPKFRSGGEEISRPLSSGRQEYFTDPQQYPLTQPMPKVESLIQCSDTNNNHSHRVRNKALTSAPKRQNEGPYSRVIQKLYFQADEKNRVPVGMRKSIRLRRRNDSIKRCNGEIEYTNDIPPSQTELFASLVLTDRGPATLAEINPQPALSIPGVVAFLSAKDIPGVNTFANILKPVVNEHELLFVEKDIQYAGQAAGVILANSQDLADYAARRVVLKYTNVKKPLLYVDDVLREGDKERIILTGSIEPTSTKDDVEQTIKGSFSYKGQYFYFYETLTCIVYPRDNNTLDVVLPTQWMQHVQEAISKLLNISSNRINVTVKRCGGGFGGKISRATLPACACALAAYLLQRPVRIVMDLESNMRAVGGRYLFLINYEAGVDNEGVIQYLKGQFYSDKGVALNDSGSARISLPVFPNVYDSSTWSVDFYDVRTDKATTTYLRAPGSLSGIGAIEHIMEHIAWTVKKDPLSVRLNNMMVDSPIPSYISDLKGNADYNVRVQHCREFNRLNQWKKRGISLVPMRFKPHYRGVYHALLSIFRNDATVAISLGVCEMGHGINTKVYLTSSAVTNFIETILGALDESLCVSAVYCDFSKAFDCAKYSVLLGKLQRCRKWLKRCSSLTSFLVPL